MWKLPSPTGSMPITTNVLAKRGHHIFGKQAHGALGIGFRYWSVHDLQRRAVKTFHVINEALHAVLHGLRCAHPGGATGYQPLKILALESREHLGIALVIF